MTQRPIKRLLVVGDTYGIPEILARAPTELIAGIVAAEIRPQYHTDLKKVADEIGVPLLIQPKKKSPEYESFFQNLCLLSPDTLICHSYSMLIHEDMLKLVNGRAFNIHMALLPRNRGPNPIQWALIHGDQKTGVTMHVMDKGFDSGPIVGQESIDILETDTWLSLFSKVKLITGNLLDRVMPQLLVGDWLSYPQDEHYALHNTRIPQESFEINFAFMSDIQVHDLIRAQIAPLKGAYLKTQNDIIRFSEYTSLKKIAELRKQYSK